MIHLTHATPVFLATQPADFRKGLDGFIALCHACGAYFTTPFYRQGSLQQLLGVSISASTVYDQCEALANALHPIFKIAPAFTAPD